MDDSAAGRVVVCRVGTERFALPVAAVRQIVSAPPVARLPGAPELIGGIANAHGTLVTTLSGPGLLGLPDRVPSEWLVVLALRNGRVGIAVEEVEDVAEGGSGLRLLEVEALIAPLLA